MQVVPVIDVRGGIAVHAVRGDRANYRPLVSQLAPTVDPIELASAFDRQLGLNTLYLADLDAIATGSSPTSLVRALTHQGSKVWIDSGAETAANVRSLLDAGADQVVLATESIADPGVLARCVREFGADRLVFSLDLRAGRPIMRTESRGLWGREDPKPLQIARFAHHAGMRQILLLDLAQTGTAFGMSRWALPLIQRLRLVLHSTRWIVGGGCAGFADLAALADADVDVALVGTALHSGTMSRDRLAQMSTRSFG